MLETAIADKPAVVLFGYGHNGFSAQEQRLLRDAAKAGIVLVAPGGNGATEPPYYPSSYSMVLGVGGAGPDGGVSRHSSLNFGVKLLAASEDLPAPAGSGLSGTVSGSSYAAASTAGMAAQLLASQVWRQASISPGSRGFAWTGRHSSWTKRSR